MKLKQAFSVEEEGYDEIVDEGEEKSLLQRFLTHIQVDTHYGSVATPLCHTNPARQSGPWSTSSIVR